MNLEEEPEGDEDCIDKIHEIEMKMLSSDILKEVKVLLKTLI